MNIGIVVAGQNQREVDDETCASENMKKGQISGGRLITSWTN